MTDTPPLHGGLLVGGKSRRMGRPKALIEVGGTTLAERGAVVLAMAVDRLVLLGDGPVPNSLSALPRIADADDCEGPLAGLLAALRSKPEAAWLVCTCDLPRITPEAVHWLLGERRPDRAAVLPRATPDGPPEPLFALYEPAALELVEQLAADGPPAPRRLADQPGVAVVDVPAPLAPCWRDVDTPSELPS
ncbi:MAG TPA: molybdenum cofactor guanylyltransferase [Thermoanaerobaculia bacterium]|nr:molybdenum cofactor guanylyltransferase [Thermoanaerobaculia bacterium]